MYVMKVYDSHQTLMEMTEKEFKRKKRLEPNLALDGYPYYDRIDSSTAHRWVKQGGHHSTNLYTEDGRIRRARCPGP